MADASVMKPQAVTEDESTSLRERKSRWRDRPRAVTCDLGSGLLSVDCIPEMRETNLLAMANELRAIWCELLSLPVFYRLGGDTILSTLLSVSRLMPLSFGCESTFLRLLARASAARIAAQTAQVEAALEAKPWLIPLYVRGLHLTPREHWMRRRGLGPFSIDIGIYVGGIGDQAHPLAFYNEYMGPDMLAHGEPVVRTPYQEELLRLRAIEVEEFRSRPISDWADLALVKRVHALQKQWMITMWRDFANVNALLRMMRQTLPWIEAQWEASGGSDAQPRRVHPLIDPTKLKGVIV